MGGNKTVLYTKELIERLEKLDGKQRIEAILANIRQDEGRFTSPLFTSPSNHLTLISATTGPGPNPSTGTAVYEFTNTPYWANNSGNLHGGAAASIYDICTSLALAPIARPGFWVLSGVSRVLTVTYLRPAPAGEVLVVECEVVAAGRKLASITARMKRKRDGVVVSTCQHEKVSTEPEVGAKL